MSAVFLRPVASASSARTVHSLAADGDAETGPAIECIVPTTAAQREIWLAATAGPEASLAFNESVVLRLHGVLDVPALAAALQQVVDRHQSLRASLTPDCTHMVINRPDTFRLHQQDLRTLDATQRAEIVEAARTSVVSEAFALESGPLFKAFLFQLAPDENELLMAAHHVVCDGWSWGVITAEIGRLYDANSIRATHAAKDMHVAGPVESDGLDAAPSFVDYAALEAAEEGGPDQQLHLDYWLQRFSGDGLPVLDLPTHRPRTGRRTFNSRRIERLMDKELVTALRQTGARSGSSLFVSLLAAFAATLTRITGQEDIVIGVPAAGQSARGMPGVVGHCVNLLALRLAVQPQLRFDALLGECQAMVLDAFEHQTVTYGTLLSHLPLEREAGRLPLVSVLFNVETDTRSRIGFAGLIVEESSVARQFENFELFLNMKLVEAGLQIEVQYNCDLFDERSVQRWIEMFECLLRSAVRDPSETVACLNVLSPQESRALCLLQPHPVPLKGAALAHAGFAAQALLQPDRPAVRDGARRCSYRELDAQSNRLARALRERGVRRGQRVGLCLDRGIDLLVGLLAVLKAGAAYVPLDPAFPPARLDHYAEDARLDLLLTSSDIATAPRAWRADAADRVFEIDRHAAWTVGSTEFLRWTDDDARPTDPAYIIYTSGSTGRPKGVCVPHCAVANLLEAMREVPGIEATERLAAVTTLSFDISVAELLLPLAAGAEIVMVQRDVAMDGERLKALLEQERVDILQATPSTWKLLIDAQWQGHATFRGWIGGEPVPAPLALDLIGRTQQLWNVYGPTETTVWSTVWRMDRQRIEERGVSIGRPLANTEVWILGGDLQPCPVGVEGEICISGEGVALGYLERPELTAERFVSVRVAGASRTVYRTGDRGRWCNDGLLEHKGRFDFQVKVRGHRIEPGEIEALCNEAAGTLRSVVVAREDQPGDVRLVAYLERAAGVDLDLGALMAHLRNRLPSFMVPQHVVTLDAMPTLPNGKIDRVALPAPQVVPRAAEQRVGPRNPRERQVLAMMEKVLSLPGLDVHDDFFRMGGHSLLAARLSALLASQFQVAVPLRTLFEASTAERLTLAIETLLQAGVGARPPLSYQLDRRSAPLTPGQERVRFMEELHPGRSVYNAPSAQRLRGDLNHRRFESALKEVARRQPALRTSIGTDAQTGQCRQQIARNIDMSVPVIDLSELPADQRETELAERMQELADRPIRLDRAPLVNMALFRLDRQEHVFVFVPHHLVWDGWSFDLLQEELSAIYEAAELGVPHRLPTLSTTHGDHAESMAEWMTQADYREHLGYWTRRAAATQLPRSPRTDMPRRAGNSGEGGTHWISVDLSTTQGLRAMARDAGVTLSTLTFALYALTIGHVIGSESIVIANPVRGRESHETENVIGYFNNMLPVPLKVDLAQPLPDFIQHVKTEMLEQMSHQQVPFEMMMAEPEFHSRIKAAGMYQAMFSFQDARQRPRSIGSLKVEQVHITQRGTTDDLSLWLMEKPSGMEGALIYNADVYLRETGAHLRERYLEILRSAVAQPSATLGQIASPEGSASAAYLTRLNPGESAKAAIQRPAETNADGEVLLLPPEHARLAQVWASVIGMDVNDIRSSDNFFDLGGDSLLAMRAVQQAEQLIGVRVEASRYLFETLGQIAVSARPGAPVANGSAAAFLRGGSVSMGGGTLFDRVLSGWSRKARQ